MQWNLFGWGATGQDRGISAMEPAAVSAVEPAEVCAVEADWKPAKGTKGRSDAARLLQSIASGGACFERLIVTRNRRVMASVAGGGRVIRLNEAFLDAPAEVLKAVGALFSSRDANTRAAARRTIREYLATVPPAEPVRRQRRRTAAARTSDLPIIRELQEEFRRVNEAHFGSSLPEVFIRLSGRMRRRNGHFSIDPLEIAISRSLCTDAAEGEALHTLRHEMIHLWQWFNGSPLGHGPEFRQWARELSVHPRATRSVCWTDDRP